MQNSQGINSEPYLRIPKSPRPIVIALYIMPCIMLLGSILSGIGSTSLYVYHDPSLMILGLILMVVGAIGSIITAAMLTYRMCTLTDAQTHYLYYLAAPNMAQQQKAANEQAMQSMQPIQSAPYGQPNQGVQPM